jgi:hypothetical protein
MSHTAFNSDGFFLQTQNIITMNSEESPVMWPLQPMGTREYSLREEMLRLELTTIKQCGG